MQAEKSRLEGMTPEDLLSQIAAGSKKAESILVSNYYRGLLFVINRQAKNTALAEDIVQDTFVVVLQKARQKAIHNPAALSSFIRQTGINLLIGNYRKETRRKTFGVDDINIHPPTDELTINRILYSKQAMQLTRQLIEELNSERDKEILRDFFVYDKNKAQICKELDLIPEHFDRVLSRARKRLKQLIQHKLGKQDGKDFSLLTVVLLVGVFVCLSEDINSFEIDVRELFVKQHLPSEAPKTSRRYMPDLNALGSTFTSISRYV